MRGALDVLECLLSRGCFIVSSKPRTPIWRGRCLTAAGYRPQICGERQVSLLPAASAARRSVRRAFGSPECTQSNASLGARSLDAAPPVVSGGVSRITGFASRARSGATRLVTGARTGRFRRGVNCTVESRPVREPPRVESALSKLVAVEALSAGGAPENGRLRRRRLHLRKALQREPRSLVLGRWPAGAEGASSRARVVRSGGKLVSFTPRRTEQWERAVRLVAQAACSAVRWEPTPATCTVTIRVQRARRAGDADNFAKAILDALNGVAFSDDRAVRSLSVEVLDGLKPGVDVRVTRDEDLSTSRSAA